MKDACAPDAANHGSTDPAMSPGTLPIIVPLAAGRVEIRFVPVFGTTRALLSFVGRPLPEEAVLRVPALGGTLEVPCQLHEGRLLSTRALSSLPHGTELVFYDDSGRHCHSLPVQPAT